MYYVFDGENYVDGYASDDEARAAAQEAIDNWRDTADPEWPDEVANVAWGKVYECAKEIPKGDEGEYVSYVLSGVK